MANITNDQGIAPLSFKAGAAVTINALVKLNTTADEVIVTSAITQVVIGVALNAAAAGESVAVQTHGIAKCVAGASISLGAQVMPEASGAGDVVTAAGATAISCGIALAAADEGDIFPVLLSSGTVNAPANS